MAIVKRLSSSYTLTAINYADDITLDASDIIVTGNLIVNGSTTSIETTNTVIKDNMIGLNDGETLAGVAGGSGFAGLTVDRGSLPGVQLLWNEPTLTWVLTNDGSTFANIVTTLGSGSALTAVINDPSPALGGNLNTNGKTISSNVGNINFSGNLQLNNTLEVPTAIAGATVVYAATPAGGQSGVFVVNGVAMNEELVTKTRAFGLSLIL